MNQQPTYVLLPGLDGTGRLFKPLLDVLPENTKFKVVTYPAICASREELIQAVKKQLPADREIIFIAESYAGPILVEILSDTDLNVRCVVFCASFVRSPKPWLLKFCGKRSLHFMLNMPGLKQISRLLTLGMGSSREKKQLFNEVIASVPTPVLAHRLRFLRTLDVAQLLESIDIPCCYLQATKDKLVPASAILDFQARLSTFVAVRIKGPHFLLQIRPRESWQAIEQFTRLGMACH